MQIPLLVTLKVIKALEECGVNYLIGGSLGSSIYGIPRATLDADLVTDLNDVQVKQLVEKLKDEFMIDADMIHDAIKRRGCFNVIHLETMFKVDIFILKNDPYKLSALFDAREVLMDRTERLMESQTRIEAKLDRLSLRVSANEAELRKVK